MESEYKLAEMEQVGALLNILAYVLIFISGQQIKKQILLHEEGEETSTNQITPSQIVALASWIRVIGVLILALVASKRLKDRQKNLFTGKETKPIDGEDNIATGATGALISYIIEAVGAQDRAETPGDTITIL